ncbi:potassium-transporting ATPase subunit F [Trichococcus palustris]
MGTVQIVSIFAGLLGLGLLLYLFYVLFRGEEL